MRLAPLVIFCAIAGCAVVDESANAIYSDAFHLVEILRLDTADSRWRNYTSGLFEPAFDVTLRGVLENKHPSQCISLEAWRVVSAAEGITYVNADPVRACAREEFAITAQFRQLSAWKALAWDTYGDSNRLTTVHWDISTLMLVPSPEPLT